MPAIRSSLAFAALVLLGASPLLARPGLRGGMWGSPVWDDGFGPGLTAWPDHRFSGPAHDDREGKVDADTFVANDAGDALGHGAVTVTTLPGSTPDAGDQAAYEAALVDQLVKAGYDTTLAKPDGGQRAEIRIVRDVLVPEEQKKKPVSGEMSVGVDSRGGSSVGMAIAIDARKPLKALISTRLEVRIVDKATDKALWEGHAQIATREGDSHWNEQAIAGRLAAALFEHFPKSSTVASR